MDPKWNRELSKFFFSSTINGLVENKSSPFIREIILSSGLDKFLGQILSVSDLFQWVYDYLSQNYRNEYIYKSALVNQVLLGRHSLNKSTLLTELRAGECKADAVILNGTSTVYEIKSEYDNIDRLSRQLRSYRKMFDHIQVITSESQLNKVLKQVESDVGVLLLDEDNEINVIQEPVSCKKHVSPDVIFDSLRKDEYINIIQNRYGEVPKVPNTRIYAECKKLFSKLSPEEAHDEMLVQLKLRNKELSLEGFLDSIPECFHAYCVSSGMKQKNSLRFHDMLRLEYKSLCVSS